MLLMLIDTVITALLLLHRYGYAIYGVGGEGITISRKYR